MMDVLAEELPSPQLRNHVLFCEEGPDFTSKIENEKARENVQEKC